jgi:hypothetical protein
MRPRLIRISRKSLGISRCNCLGQASYGIKRGALSQTALSFSARIWWLTPPTQAKNSGFSLCFWEPFSGCGRGFGRAGDPKGPGSVRELGARGVRVPGRSDAFPKIHAGGALAESARPFEPTGRNGVRRPVRTRFVTCCRVPAKRRLGGCRMGCVEAQPET